MSKVGFIGVGTMGCPMATNIISKGNDFNAAASLNAFTKKLPCKSPETSPVLISKRMIFLIFRIKKRHWSSSLFTY